MLASYVRWLHTGWPAGTVEKLPEVNDDGTTARARRARRRRPDGRAAAQVLGRHRRARGAGDRCAKTTSRSARAADGVVDLAIIGGGVSGIAAAIEAKKAGLSYVVFEAAQEFRPSPNFPKAKPIYTYPTEMTPAGQMQLTADVKEALLEELEAQRRAFGIDAGARTSSASRRRAASSSWSSRAAKPVRALRVIIAIGRSGNYRALGVPGEKLDKVYHRLYDPKELRGQEGARRRRRRLGAGDGDRARHGRRRRHARLPRQGIRAPQAGERRQAARAREGSARRRADRAARLRARQHGDGPQHDARDAGACGRARARRRSAASSTRCARTRSPSPTARGKTETLPNDVVFAMIGREAPLDFFRRSGIPIRGEWRARDVGRLPRVLRALLLRLHVEGGHRGQPLLQRAQAVPVQYRADRLGRIRKDAVRRARLARFLLFARLLRGHRPVRLRSAFATEDALRHAPDADADGGPGDPAVPLAVYRFAVDGKRGAIRSRDIETGRR